MSGSPAATLLLVAPGLLALAALFAHAWRARGPRVAVAFFAASFVFGLLRGNFIGWFMRDASRQLGLGGDGGLMPYVMRAPLLRIGYASLFECFGWMLALYLAWTLSERVLERAPAARRRLFPLLLFASVFTGALGYAVEAGANAMQWWTWTLPLRSKLLVEVPAPGLWAWFSVGVDFLLPFLLILERPRFGRHWLALLLFPAHMASNLLDLVVKRPGWGALGEPSWLAHLAMLTALVLLAGSSRREVAVPGKDPAQAAAPWTWLPVASAGVVLAVIWVGLGPLGGRWDLWAATSPLFVFLLLAVPALPLGAVAIAAAVCAPLAAGRGLAAAVPLLVLGILAMDASARRRRVLAASVACVLAATLAWQVALGRAERAYWRARVLEADWPRALRSAERLSASVSALHLQSGNAFSAAGNHELAAGAYRAALRLEPDLAPAHNGLGLSLLGLGRAPEAIESLERAARLVPRSEGLQQNLGLAQLAAGRLDAARASFERARSLDPDDPRPVIGLARVAGAAGHLDEAARILTDAIAAGRGAALEIELGGLHQDAGRLDLAERHFTRAAGQARGAEAAAAYARLAVLLAGQPGRLADAQRAAEAAVARDRSDLTLDTLGWVLLKAGRPTEAQAVLLEALAASEGGPVRQRIEQHLAEATGS